MGEGPGDVIGHCATGSSPWSVRLFCWPTADRDMQGCKGHLKPARAGVYLIKWVCAFAWWCAVPAAARWGWRARRCWPSRCPGGSCRAARSHQGGRCRRRRAQGGRKGGEEVHLTLDLLPFVRELCLGSDLRSLRPKPLIATWCLSDCGKSDWTYNCGGQTAAEIHNLIERNFGTSMYTYSMAPSALSDTDDPVLICSCCPQTYDVCTLWRIAYSP